MTTTLQSPVTGTSAKGDLRPSKRDERLDFLRGLAMLAVIINHVHLRSLYQIFTVEAIGVVTAAEMFVFLSGVIVGMVNHDRLMQKGWATTSGLILKRAFQIWAAAAVAILLVYCLQWVPGLDVSSLTTYTEPKTKTVYSLYGENPSAAKLIARILLLRYGPGEINILGLYVTLLAITPGLFWFLQKKLAPALLLVSWCIWGYYQARPTKVLPCQSENAFPILAWQLPFVHGLVVGYYRDEIGRLFSGKTGRRILLVAFGLFLAFCFFALNNPWNDIPGPTRFSLIPESAYYWAYLHFFQRPSLGLGRLFNTVLAVGVLYAILTRYWEPIRRFAGWFFIPLGQATLYIFIIHILFVLAVSNLGLAGQKRVYLNTLVNTIILGLVWLMVRFRVGFRWIPR